MRKGIKLRVTEETKRGHGQLNIGLEITASVTVCQVRNKDRRLNGLRTSVWEQIKGREQRNQFPLFHEPRGTQAAEDVLLPFFFSKPDYPSRIHFE
jgi:hypothetical protein